MAPILFPREVAPGLYELVYNSYLRAGIDMQSAYQSSQISSSLSMVEAGFGFALVPQSMTCITLPNVSYHPLMGTPLKTDIAIARRRYERSRTVKRFWPCFNRRGDDDRKYLTLLKLFKKGRRWRRLGLAVR